MATTRTRIQVPPTPAGGWDDDDPDFWTVQPDNPFQTSLAFLQWPTPAAAGSTYNAPRMDLHGLLWAVFGDGRKLFGVVPRSMRRDRRLALPDLTRRGADEGSDQNGTTQAVLDGAGTSFDELKTKER